MTPNTFVQQFPGVAELLRDANHIDTQTVEGQISLRQFIAGTLSYQPRWVTGLYYIRWAFVRLLGMKQEGIPDHTRFSAADVPMIPGEYLGFFKVDAAQEDRYWVSSIEDQHLAAHLVAAVEPCGDRYRFYATTIVHYRNWAGPIYFNAIRPFHLLLVALAVRSAVRQPPVQAIKSASSG
ncbi:MAG TPA: DUF2867 domain-containing protein [Phototrophicaceae bacterium]|nr:DUF2867 domain-containing protein [Phototrophicaceae bacterium]